MLKSMTSDKVVQFKSNETQDNFLKVYNRRVNQYFKDNNTTKYANREMHIKTVVAILSWIGVYSLIMTNTVSFSAWALVGTFTLLGFVNIFIAFNIVHDACHNAYSKNPKVNKRLGYFMNFIGANRYLFTMMHNAHHAFVNIHGIDVTLETHGLFRFTPHEPHKPMHKWQHIYTPIVYALAMIHWTLIKDFKWYYQERNIGNLKNIEHDPKEFWILLFSKLVYYTLTLVLPLIFVAAPYWVIILGWVMIHILPGLTFAIVFQCTHVYNGTTYPMPDENNDIHNNYALHVLATTADFSRKNKVITWLLGAINIHVIHHILPTVCHVHYMKLTDILVDTCKEFGIEYQENPNLWQAFKKHMEMLEILSHEDAYVPEYKPNHFKLGV